MSQRRSIETSLRAAAAAYADISLEGEETVLLTAARMGHPTAFGDLVERHAVPILRMALRITRHREDAEDVVQDCFKSAFAHFNSFRGQSRFSTWLTRIGLNCALMKIRARQRETGHLDDSTEAVRPSKHDHIPSSCPTPEQSYWRRELESILAEEIAKLKPNLQRALLLRYMEGLKIQEAAQVLGIPNSTVKSRVRRARLGLRPGSTAGVSGSIW